MGWKRKRLEAMGEEDLNDVTLVGTDGVEVPCSKAILAAVSRVFRVMFFKDYKERNADSCNLNFHSETITLVVKYCYCGEVDMDLILNKNRSLEEEASLLVDVCEAGRYFEIDDLSSAIEVEIGKLVFHQQDKKRYQYAPVFLTELFKQEKHNEALGSAIFQFSVDNMIECFGPRAPGSNDKDPFYTHPSILSKVLQQTDDNYAAVRCIQTWCNLEKGAGKSYSDEEKRPLIEVADSIDLKRLDTNELSNIKPCPLFSSERILEAFVHHCKRNEIIPEIPPAIYSRLFVSGAEMDCLNGFYRQVGYKGVNQKVFMKEAEYNGIPCKHIIHYRHKESKWVISIAKHNWKWSARRNSDQETGIDNGLREVSRRYIQRNVYESSGQSLSPDDPMIPPFNGWKCFNDGDPVPIIASSYKYGRSQRAMEPEEIPLSDED